MTITRVNSFISTIEQGNPHPYLNGAWTPNRNEYDATDLEVIGEIPADLDGIYLRNTENPLHQPLGRYHPFDGDGMIHAMRFEGGRATYRNRFVRTRAFAAEQEAGRALWAGIAEHPARSERPGWGAREGLKDASSTDVIVHAGRALSTFYQCGEGYRLDPHTLDTLGIEAWTPIDGISAHPKVDPVTGELLFFNYSKHAPYHHYGVVDRDNRLVHYTAVPLPGPRLPHDMAFTPNWTILVDLPLFWEPALLAKGQHVPVFHPDLPTRFGILPRYGTAEQVRWFEAAPTYVLHWNNAWEDGDVIELDGYFQEQPSPPPLAHAPAGLGTLMAGIDGHSFRPRLHRWRFDLRTGAVTETRLDDRTLEFGTIDQRRAGRHARYRYSATLEPGWFLFDGLVKHDLETGRSWTLPFGPGRFGSEAPFAPRVGGVDEDDGYLVSFITDMAADRSECVVIDARDIEAGPVCRIVLPERICSGTHACWADAAELRPAEGAP
ncbi:MAG: carotenoid oxygenase family protein [Pseudomonadales bacterium]|jgi:carotenoid cleavage dioxygenase|nr:carotenoid oxygenase family protein [Pseudomonadales bacterium]